GRWWMAQNLNYTKNLINNPTPAVSPTTLGTYFCPNGLSFAGKAVSATTTVNNELLNAPTNIAAACNTYGAVYGQTTIMSRNGMSPTQDNLTLINDYSTSQGICPKGWVLPGRKDYAVMFNKVAGCTDDTKAQTPIGTSAAEAIAVAPCHHHYNAVAGTGHSNGAIVTNGPLLLRSTLSDRMTAPDDSVFATATKPTWTWLSVGSKRHHGARPIDYYGFSVLPAGLSYISGSYIRYYAVGLSTWPFISTGTSESMESYCIWRATRTFSYEALSTSVFGTVTRCVRAYNLDQ
ncbi:MAG: FISUMP domain-containing protein, partial [Bacteroidales bacterium]